MDDENNYRVDIIDPDIIKAMYHVRFCLCPRTSTLLFFCPLCLPSYPCTHEPAHFRPRPRPPAHFRPVDTPFPVTGEAIRAVLPQVFNKKIPGTFTVQDHNIIRFSPSNRYVVPRRVFSPLPRRFFWRHALASISASVSTLFFFLRALQSRTPFSRGFYTGFL